MTRKHFQALADAMRGARPGRAEFPAQWRQWARDVGSLADACASFNTGFQRDRFLRACGMGE